MTYDFEPLLVQSSDYFNLCEQIEECIKLEGKLTNENLTLDWDADIQFNKEIHELNQNNSYYYGCPYTTYSDTYKTRMDNFFHLFQDGKEIDFIKEELNKGINYIPYNYINPIARKNISYSLAQRIEYLEERAQELGYNIRIWQDDNYAPFEYGGQLIYNPEDAEGFELIKTEKISKKTIDFTGTQVQLMELVKALIENKSVRGKQKDIVKDFTDFFGLEVKSPDKIIQDIKNRNTGSETLFLNDLKSSLMQFISKENKR